MENTTNNEQNLESNVKTKFCKFCGEKIPMDAILCTKCGRQVEEIKNESTPQIIVNNTNDNTNANVNTNINANMAGKKACNKWVAFLLCFFLGYLGAHKFYEGKVGMGILYIFTFGLFGFGWLIDTIVLLFKPNPYYPK